jgi:membrane-associated phospholipid phosphatase
MSRSIGLTDGGGESATDTIGAPGSGSDGTISMGNPVVRPIGISPSINTAPDEDWFRGNQWPPENTEPPNGSPTPWQQNSARHFTPVTFPGGPNHSFVVTMPPRGWSPASYEIVLLIEFARAWVPDPALETNLNGILTNALLAADQEKCNLIAIKEFRAGLMEEVLAQMTAFGAYFQGALGYGRSTQPSTNYLVQGAMRAAEFAAMYYKNLYQRPRPWQLWPGLMPPVLKPDHASFPGLHATQAYTVAAVLSAVASVMVPSVEDITTRLAQRIARGREVLGLNYPSDAVAGELIAAQVTAAYLGCPTVSRLVMAARQEWLSFTV